MGALLLQVIMPLAIGIIMLGIGLSLSKADFINVYHHPRPMIIGLCCQLVLLPLIAFGLIQMADLHAELAVGMMLLSASPGGPSSNLFSNLADGDVALNVTMTAINSVLAIFLLPLIVNFSTHYFMHTQSAVPLQFGKVIEIFFIVLIPISIGMMLRHKYQDRAMQLAKTVKIGSGVFLAVLIVIAIKLNADIVAKYFFQIGLIALAFNVISLGIGYFVPSLFKIAKKQAIAIAFEIGIHNGTLAIFIATVYLHNDLIAIPAAIYSILMFLTASGMAYVLRR